MLIKFKVTQVEMHHRVAEMRKGNNHLRYSFTNTNLLEQKRGWTGLQLTLQVQPHPAELPAV